MKEPKETNKFECEFCKRGFVREKTLFTHLCEYKRRWVDRDKKSNIIAFQAWLQFYEKTTVSKKKNKTYKEFIKSAYYTAFVKFGSYCVSINALNIKSYVDWLIRFNVRIDDWTSDSVYDRYLKDYLKVEDPYDAIKRGIEFFMNMSEEERIQPSDCLRFVNPNKICFSITKGKISPWLLYQSKGGQKFMDSINEEHLKIIFDYVDPEFWALKFRRDQALTKEIQELLNVAGY